MTAILGIEREKVVDAEWLDNGPGWVGLLLDSAHTVRLEQGYPAAQVFAPVADNVICFEPMTVPTNALNSGDRLSLVAPGERYIATFSFTVERS